MNRVVTSSAMVLSLASGLLASVPTYDTFVLYARTNFASNPGGSFNVPGSWFFSGEDIKVNDARDVGFHLSVTSGDFHSIWFGKLGAGNVVTGGVVHNGAEGSFFSRVGLNNSGRVVWENQFAPPNGIYTYNSATNATSLYTQKPVGTSSWSSPTVNDSGQVGYRASFSGSGQAWVSWDPTNPLNVAFHAVEAGVDVSSPYSFLFTPNFNNARQIAGHVRLGTAGQTGNSQPDQVRLFNADGSSTLIAEDRDSNIASPISSIDSSAVGLNNLGRVAYVVNLVAGGRAIYLSSPSGPLEIARTTAPGSPVSDIEFFPPSVNDSGLVVFRAIDTAGKRVVWVGDGSTLRRVVTAQDILPSDLGPARVDQNVASSPVFGGAPGINSNGDVSFNAGLTPPGDNQIEWGTGVYVAIATVVPPPCPGDINGDRVVNTADLTALLGNFGQSVAPGTGGDFDSSGFVNTADLTFLLGVFGTTCP